MSTMVDAKEYIISTITKQRDRQWPASNSNRSYAWIGHRKWSTSGDRKWHNNRRGNNLMSSKQWAVNRYKRPVRWAVMRYDRVGCTQRSRCPGSAQTLWGSNEIDNLIGEIHASINIYKACFIHRRSAYGANIGLIYSGCKRVIARCRSYLCRVSTARTAGQM